MRRTARDDLMVRFGRPATIRDVVELLGGIGRMMQQIDAKLEEIVRLLRTEEEDE